MQMIETLENVLERKAGKQLLPMEVNDVQASYADVGLLVREAGYQPDTPLRRGIERFMAQYLDFHRRQ
jgi:UDP-glucuronate 4-epimerase